MLLEWDMSGPMLIRGRCTATVDLLVCNTRNEDLIVKNKHALVSVTADC